MEANIYVMSVQNLCLEHHIVAKDKKFTDGTKSI